MFSKLINFWLFLFVAWSIQVSISSADFFDDRPVVMTSIATLHGKRLDVHPHQLPNFRRSVWAFTRIPYAEPPVGELRFARPVPKVIHGFFDATRGPISCPQVFSPEFDLRMDSSEDCLFLDVFVPEPMPTSAAVMVWIHGGGYHLGVGTIPRALPAPLAAFGDVIVVTCNYRLGPLGFSATGDESIPANLGMLDQRQVLLWVQENIEAFGGDPSRVTIFGESAGSGSVNLHMLSAMSAGLFSRAIMQSGSVGASWVHHDNMKETVQMTLKIGKALGCDVSTSSELVACLRQKPEQDFIDVYGNRSPLFGELFVRPVADGQFLLDYPPELASEGSFNEADVMIGCMQDEGTVFLLNQEGSDPSPLDRSAFREALGRTLGTQDPLTLDVASYVYSTVDQLMDPEADHFPSLVQLLGDTAVVCHTFAITEQLAKAGRNVYTYVMTHVPSHSMWGSNYTWLGAAHAEDMPYVFGLPFLLDPEAVDDYTIVGRFGNQEEVEISLQMMTYWSNFAKTGDPNLSTRDDGNMESKYPTWPKFTSLEPMYKALSSSFENRAGKANTIECHFLEKVLPTFLENTAEVTRLKSLLED